MTGQPNQGRGRRRLIAFGLTFVSILATLAALEGILQLTLSAGRLYSNLPGNPAHNQWRNEVQFHEKYAGDPDATFAGYDPMLGWDSGTGAARIRGPAPTPERRPGTRRIVAVGDSFVFGNEVAADENFSALLNAGSTQLEVLNMGVPGYGIDQAYLKYHHHGASWQPEIVIFGVFVADYERSSIAFSAFSKPRFSLRGERIVLENQPVPHPTLELERIGAALQGRIYLLELIENAWRKLTHGRAEARFFEATDRVVTHILSQLVAELADHQELLVLHIPRGESFAKTDPFEAELQRRLLALYRSLDLQVIDLYQAFLEELPAKKVAQRYYVNRPGGAIGHLSPAGHQRVAQLLVERLQLHL